MTYDIFEQIIFMVFELIMCDFIEMLRYEIKLTSFFKGLIAETVISPSFDGPYDAFE